MRVSPLLLFLHLGAAFANESDYNRGVDAYRSNDFAAARVAWDAAVGRGDHAARNNLGYLLYHGLGGPKDQERAVSLWRVAAVAGQSEAQWHLGQAYLQGAARPQSAVRAYAWFKCAIATAELPGARMPEAEVEVASEARRSLQRLADTLSYFELIRGESLAAEYIRAYAKRGET